MDFKIPQSYTESVKQIGNSVCPPIAHQIGMALRYEIEKIEECKFHLLKMVKNYHLTKEKASKLEKREKRLLTTIVI